MGVLKQGRQIIVAAFVVGMATWAFGQDAPDTSAPAGSVTAVTPAQANAEDSELAAEVQQLRNEVDRLKRQVAYLNSVVTELENERVPVERTASRPAVKTPKKGANGGSTPAITADAPPPAPDVEERVTKTLLVFRDGHKTEAINYAIVGQTLWIYTETDSKKVPLADLDVAATKSANSDRGVTFQVPPTK
ncbi:MAG TPA: bZIP transcription factor [Terriglobales bacterium]|nr:bZIP transcription factor [Terriglobales bacterium]